jgi:uncharacterized protein (UPF0335 family)
MSDTIAAGQVRAFVDRVLRLKEEQDTLAADIRDIYAEAKGMGFDKTAIGQVVAHVRKIGKIGVSAVEEKQTVFDMYMDAYERGVVGTRVAIAHTHEKSNPAVAGERTALAAREVDESAAPIPHSSALPTVQADNAGEVAASPSASPAAIPDADVPAFLLKERPSLRPLCQDPTNCAGHGHKTCHACLMAAGQSEAA